MLFSLLKHYLELYVTDTALKYPDLCTVSLSHGVENYFPRLWGKDVSDAILYLMVSNVISQDVGTGISDVILILAFICKSYTG